MTVVCYIVTLCFNYMQIKAKNEVQKSKILQKPLNIQKQNVVNRFKDPNDLI